MPWLTKTIANIGATNVQMAFVPYPEDNQQLDFKWETRKLIKVSASQKSYWEQHRWYFNCTLLGILLMDTSLHIYKDTARTMHRAVLQHLAEWASPWPAVLS